MPIYKGNTLMSGGGTGLRRSPIGQQDKFRAQVLLTLPTHMAMFCFVT